jgi:beta-galactosidase
MSLHPPLPSGRLFFGGDYNPEQWPESVWLEDMRLMREAGVNLVSIGIFSWAKLQSAPGVFHFDWLDRLMDLLAENGIMADLATGTASPPAWLIKLHPDILPTLDDGTVLSHGSRQHYNPSSSAYRAACAEFVTALASRYARHPALAMWHINNEYACHVRADYGDETAIAFREWLRARYGSLEALNDAWGTAFWSQHYYSWDEILPPRAAPTYQNPGQCLDFARFSSDALLECCLAEKRILRAITPDKPVTTNFMEWVKALDYHKWALELDFTSLDIYPEPIQPSRYPLGLSSDMTRCWNPKVPWIVMEQVTTHVNWRTRNATKPPGLMRLWSYAAIARGADGICFFQWRQSRAGAEKFHGSMVGHGNPATQRCYQETKQLGNELARLGELAGTRVHAEVAIYFDQENWWALELPSKPNSDLKYPRSAGNFHTPLQQANLATDFVFADTDLSRYRVLFAPALYMVKPGVAEKLAAFVAAGGQLVLTYFSGIVDEHDRVHLGGYPAPFRALLGLEVEEWAVPPDDRATALATTAAGLKLGLPARLASSFWAESIRAETCEVLATFTEGFLAGRPAITRRAHGRGHAWYVGTELDAEGYAALTRVVTEAAGVRARLNVPDGVEVCERRSADGTRYIFLLNHADTPAIVSDSALQGHELLSASDVTAPLTLPALGVAIIRN